MLIAVTSHLGTEKVTTLVARLEDGEEQPLPFPALQRAASSELTAGFQCHSHSNFTCLCSF